MTIIKGEIEKRKNIATRNFPLTEYPLKGKRKNIYMGNFPLRYPLKGKTGFSHFNVILIPPKNKSKSILFSAQKKV